MKLLFEGIKIGLVLCFLVGPLFIALIQAGVEKGFRAGTMMGLGIWISDLLFIGAVYWGISYVSRLIEWKNFPVYLGLVGSIVLVVFGLAILLAKTPSFKPPSLAYAAGTSSYLSLWLKGFLINTINPFTVFFWMGLMSTVIIKDDLNNHDALLFFSGIMGTIVTTDFVKVLLAREIRKWLKPIHVLWFRRVSGVALILFGIGLFVRVFFLI